MLRRTIMDRNEGDAKGAMRHRPREPVPPVPFHVALPSPGVEASVRAIFGGRAMRDALNVRRAAERSGAEAREG